MTHSHGHRGSDYKFIPLQIAPSPRLPGGGVSPGPLATAPCTVLWWRRLSRTPRDSSCTVHVVSRAQVWPRPPQSWVRLLLAPAPTGAPVLGEQAAVVASDEHAGHRHPGGTATLGHHDPVISRTSLTPETCRERGRVGGETAEAGGQQQARIGSKQATDPARGAGPAVGQPRSPWQCPGRLHPQAPPRRRRASVRTAAPGTRTGRRGASPGAGGRRSAGRTWQGRVGERHRTAMGLQAHGALGVP